MKKPNRSWLLSAVTIALAGSVFASPAMAQNAPAPSDFAASIKGQAEINEDLLKLTDDERMYFQHVTTLSNPFFEGRAPGLRGNELAAEYIEFNFNKLNLSPAFLDDGAATMRQKFSSGSETKVVRQDVTLTVGGEARKLTPGTESSLLLLGTGAAGKVAASGPVVFVGYGVQGGPDGYNTFPVESKPADAPKEGEAAKEAEPVKPLLSGKIAMVFRFEPMNDAGRSKWVENAARGEWSARAGYKAKVDAISYHKPAAIVIVAPPGCDDARAEKLDELRGVRGLGRPGMPVFMISTAVAEQIAKAGGTTLMELRKLADNQGTVVELSKATLAADFETKRESTPTQNVGAVLKGRGALADEVIVIGAHFDHVGYGYQGSRAGPRGAGKLHPGADDNASGTSGLLMAAARMRDLYAQLPPDAQARTIMFVGFSGEELGLLGSQHFVKNTPIPESKTYAMLNMDMIGRVRKHPVDPSKDRVEVDGVDTAEGFMDLLTPLFDRSGLKVDTVPGGNGPSDHASFYRAKVPVLHFFTGLHSQYHMPEDFYFTINPVGAMKVVNLLCDTAMTLATRSEPLAWKQAKGPSINLTDPALRPSGVSKDAEPKPLEDQQAARKAAMDAAAAAHGEAAGNGDTGRLPVKVRFGIMPGDYSNEEGGVLIGGVTAGTSADLAGLKANDRMVRWNGQELKNVNEWMPMLGKAKPGDKIEIVYIRDGKEMKTTATLKAADNENK